MIAHRSRDYPSRVRRGSLLRPVLAAAQPASCPGPAAAAAPTDAVMAERNALREGSLCTARSTLGDRSRPPRALYRLSCAGSLAPLIAIERRSSSDVRPRVGQEVSSEAHARLPRPQQSGRLRPEHPRPLMRLAPTLRVVARSQRLSTARLREATGWAPTMASAREGITELVRALEECRAGRGRAELGLDRRRSRRR